MSGGNRLRLIQIPFSHNCVKVRRALELKGLDYETHDIAPMDRSAVSRSSGQALVPVLEDGGKGIADSTAILRHLEQAYPEPSLLPEDPALHAECWLLEDWADRAFMALTRRIAYWNVLVTPGALEQLWFSDASALKRFIGVRVGKRAVTRRFRLSAGRNKRDEAEAKTAAALALERLAGRPFLLGDRLTVADVSLATMAAPLIAGRAELRSDSAIKELIAWAGPVVGERTLALYGSLTG